MLSPEIACDFELTGENLVPSRDVEDVVIFTAELDADDFPLRLRFGEDAGEAACGIENLHPELGGDKDAALGLSGGTVAKGFLFAGGQPHGHVGCCSGQSAVCGDLPGPDMLATVVTDVEGLLIGGEGDAIRAGDVAFIGDEVFFRGGDEVDALGGRLGEVEMAGFADDEVIALHIGEEFLHLALHGDGDDALCLVLAGIEAAIGADLQPADAGEIIEEEIGLTGGDVDFVDAFAGLHIGEEDIARCIGAEAIREVVAACGLTPRLVVDDELMQGGVLGGEGTTEEKGEEE